MYGARKGFVYSHSGDNGRKDPPVPIPNTEVKLSRAESTCRDTDREDRSSPLFNSDGLSGLLTDRLFLCVGRLGRAKRVYTSQYFVALAFLPSPPASPYGKGRCHEVMEGIRKSAFDKVNRNADINPQKGRHLLCSFCPYEKRKQGETSGSAARDKPAVSRTAARRR